MYPDSRSVRIGGTSLCDTRSQQRDLSSSGSVSDPFLGNGLGPPALSSVWTPRKQFSGQSALAIALAIGTSSYQEIGSSSDKQLFIGPRDRLFIAPTALHRTKRLCWVSSVLFIQHQMLGDLFIQPQMLGDGPQILGDVGLMLRLISSWIFSARRGGCDTQTY